MASRRLAHQNEPIEPSQFFGHWSGAAAGLRILEDVEDAPADLVGRDAEGNPVILGRWIEACAEVKGPAISVEMRRSVRMNFGRRHDEDGVGERHRLHIEVAEEVSWRLSPGRAGVGVDHERGLIDRFKRRRWDRLQVTEQAVRPGGIFRSLEIPV